MGTTVDVGTVVAADDIMVVGTADRIVEVTEKPVAIVNTIQCTCILPF